MRFGWVLGWAVSPDWFAVEVERVWPGAEHVFVAAAPDWRERLAEAGPLDRLGGYSFGTLLLLRERAWVAERWPRTALLAPIWAFPSEAGRGGRISRAQLRLLRRWLRHDAERARSEFGAMAGLPSAALVVGSAASSETLEWGLEQLDTGVAEPGLPPGWFAATGMADALCDAGTLAGTEPGLSWVSGAGHAPGPLLRAWAQADGMAG